MSSGVCYNCMQKMSGKTCKCGFDIDNYVVQSYHLCPTAMLKDKYQVGRVLGEGGFGITYVGYDTMLERKVAIKEFYLNGYASRNNTVSYDVVTGVGDKKNIYDANLEKFLREGQLLAKFGKCEGIVSVIDYFRENGTAYLVMEFLEGQTLSQRIRKHGKIKAKEMMDIMYPIMTSLEEMHNEGYIHRDISPDNIIITTDRKSKLLDFGAARSYGENGADNLTIILKPGYAPYEQCVKNRKQGPWSDVYSLCATIYRCMTGKTPDNSVERLGGDELKKIYEQERSCPKSFGDAIAKGMAVKSEDRYQSVAELRNDLIKSLAGYERKDPVHLPDKEDKVTEILPMSAVTDKEDVSIGSGLGPISIHVDDKTSKTGTSKPGIKSTIGGVHHAPVKDNAKKDPEPSSSLSRPSIDDEVTGYWDSDGAETSGSASDGSTTGTHTVTTSHTTKANGFGKFIKTTHEAGAETGTSTGSTGAYSDSYGGEKKTANKGFGKYKVSSGADDAGSSEKEPPPKAILIEDIEEVSVAENEDFNGDKITYKFETGGYDSDSSSDFDRNTDSVRETEYGETELLGDESPVVDIIPPKKKKKSVKPVVIVFLLIAIAVSGYFIYQKVEENRRQNTYNEAIWCVDAGEYQQAIDLFTSLGEYSDAADQINEANYQWAGELLDNKEFEAAIEKYNLVTGHDDVADKIALANKEIENRDNYNDAIALYESEQYEKAMAKFLPLNNIGYEDSANYLKKSYYGYACQLMDKSGYENAIKYFKMCNGYAESNEKIKECHYQQGCQLLSIRKYEEAIKNFNQVSNYLDSARKIQDAKFGYSTEVVNKGASGTTGARTKARGYLKELEADGYSGAKDLYAELTKWHAEIVANSSTTDSNTNVSVVNAGSELYFHIKIWGGDESAVSVKVEADGAGTNWYWQNSGSRVYKYYDGQDDSFRATIIATSRTSIRFYIKTTNGKLIGENTVQVQ